MPSAFSASITAAAFLAATAARSATLPRARKYTSSPAATSSTSRNARPARWGNARVEVDGPCIGAGQYSSRVTPTGGPVQAVRSATLVVDETIADVADRLDEDVATVLELA